MTRKRNLPLLLLSVFTLFLGSCVPLTPAPSAYPNPSSPILWVTVSPEQLKKNEAVLAIAKPLIEKAQKVYSMPGWIHVQSETQSFQFGSSTLPDGTPIPKTWQDESWILVAQHGRAVQSVLFEDRKYIQMSKIVVFKNGVWTNLASRDTWGTLEKTYPLRLDSGFLEDAENNKNTVELEYDTDAIDAERVAVFTISYPNFTSIEGKPKQLPKNGFTKFYFSMNTGLLLKIEEYRSVSEGQIRLFTRIATLIFEKVEQPPAEVLKYLTYAPVTPVPNENNYESEYCQIPSVQLSISDAKGLSDDEIAGKLIELLLAYFNAPQAPDWCRIDGYKIDKVYYDERTPSLPLEPKGDIMRVVQFSIKFVQIPNFWMSWPGDIDQQQNWLHTGKNVAVFRSNIGYTMKFANP